MKTKRVSFVIGKNGKVKAKSDKKGLWLIVQPPVKAFTFNLPGVRGIGFDPASPVQDL